METITETPERMLMKEGSSFFLTDDTGVRDILQYKRRTADGEMRTYLNSDDMNVLRKHFFEEAGLYKLDAYPNHLIIRKPSSDDRDGRALLVVSQSDGDTTTFWEKLVLAGERSDWDSWSAARAWFEANSEPKPWKTAERGTVWTVDYLDHGGQQIAGKRALVSDRGTFLGETGREIELTDTVIEFASLVAEA